MIGVDTSVIHLAGAMAKPVWTLVAIPGDWRWLEDRDDSPWYPTMRLFRQREPGDWDSVLERLRAALEHEVERHLHRCTADAAIDTSVAAAISRKSIAPSPTNFESGMCRLAETRVGLMMYFPEQPTGRALEHYGEYLLSQAEALKGLLKPGMQVLEAGAGVGAHSLPMAMAVGANGHLLLYENDSLLKQVLRENLRANRITNATLMRRTLGNTHERGGPDPNAPAGAGVPDNPEAIDDLRLESLHWLRIDESADALGVLEGGQATLWRLRPGLFVGARDDEALMRIATGARDYGYACWRLETPMFNPANFNGRSEDIFGGRVALALVAVPEESGIEIAIERCERMTSGVGLDVRALPRQLGVASSAPELDAAKCVEEVHALASEGRLGESLALADSLLKTSLDDADLVLARASTLFEWGRYSEALPEFVRADALGSRNFNLYLRAGWILHLERRRRGWRDMDAQGDHG